MRAVDAGWQGELRRFERLAGLNHGGRGEIFALEEHEGSVGLRNL